jgi:hypothetical protein
MSAKISTLPREIRDQLNRRIDDGQNSAIILPWLNALPTVQEILAAEFDSMPVSRQNLADWRKGGFRDWVDRRDILELARLIASDNADLAKAAPQGTATSRSPVENKCAQRLDPFDAASSSNDSETPESSDSAPPPDPSLTDQAVPWFAARYLLMARALLVSLEERSPADKLAPMSRICRDLIALRRSDHTAARLRLEQERLAHRRAVRAPKKNEKKEKRGLDDPEMIYQVKCELFGEDVIAPSEAADRGEVIYHSDTGEYEPTERTTPKMLEILKRLKEKKEQYVRDSEAFCQSHYRQGPCTPVQANPENQIAPLDGNSQPPAAQPTQAQTAPECQPAVAGACQPVAVQPPTQERTEPCQSAYYPPSNNKIATRDGGVASRRCILILIVILRKPSVARCP